MPDPMGQYWSPYLAMGNNPIGRVDVNGGTDGNPDPCTGDCNYDPSKDPALILLPSEIIVSTDGATAFREDLVALLSSIFSANPRFGVQFWGDGSFGGGGQVLLGRDWKPGMEVINVNIKDMNQVMSLFERADLKRPRVNNRTLTPLNPNEQERIENGVNAILKADGAAEALYNIIQRMSGVHKDFIQVIEYSPGEYYNYNMHIPSDSAKSWSLEDTVTYPVLKGLGGDAVRYWSNKAKEK